VGRVVGREIAKETEFFSFGIKDLTQTTLAMSRDDSGRSLPAYAELNIVVMNPFAAADAHVAIARLVFYFFIDAFSRS
jgi:pyruvate,orthophosphate dikinase